MKTELKNKKIIFEKLQLFGFERNDKEYIYTADIVDGQFAMTMTVSFDGDVDTKVVDKTDGEEYVLHLTDDAIGSFVGKVREDYDKVIENFLASCCENEIFKAEFTKKLLAYAKQTYGDEPEFLWEKFTDNAVLRRKDNQKWYAVILTVSKRKLGLDSDEIVEIVDLRMNPDELERTVNATTYFRGWHMNKKHWITIILDGSVGFDEICQRLENSYSIAGGKG